MGGISKELEKLIKKQIREYCERKLEGFNCPDSYIEPTAKKMASELYNLLWEFLKEDL